MKKNEVYLGHILDALTHFERYQVSVSVIRDIKRGKTWRHVPWPTVEAMVKLAA